MSFQEEWVLPEPVERYTDADLLARVRALLPEGAAVAISGAPAARAIEVGFPAALVDALAEKLSSRAGQLDWDWRDELDPPRSADGRYAVQIELVDDAGPLLRVSSHDADNRLAWPLAFSLASSLAEELGALADEDAPPSSDRLPMFIEPGRITRPN